MRRIITFDAVPGMVLHAPLTLPDGEPQFAGGHVLTEADLAMLQESPGIEIEVEDALSAYARDRPIFPAAAEGATLQALNTLIMMHPGVGQPVAFHALEQLLATIAAMVEAAYAGPQGTMDLAGPDSLQGHDYVHPVKTMEVAIVIARSLGMPRIETTAVATAAALMNIGYAALRRSLLDEPRGLEEHEWRHQVEKHPEYSVRILAEAGLKDDVLQAIADHHERWDGSGYPRGLAAMGIPLAARIIAVADTYVSLRSRRAYRNASAHPEAVALLERDAGAAFDPDLVRVFIDAATTLVPASDRSAAASANAAASPTDDGAAHAGARPQAMPDESVPADVAREAVSPEETLSQDGRGRGPTRVSVAAVNATARETTRLTGAPRVGVAAPKRIGQPAPSRGEVRRRVPVGRRGTASLWSAGFYLETRGL